MFVPVPRFLRGIFFFNSRFVLSCFCHSLAVKVLRKSLLSYPLLAPLSRLSFLQVPTKFPRSLAFPVGIKKDQTSQSLVFSFLLFTDVLIPFSESATSSLFCPYKLRSIPTPFPLVKFFLILFFYTFLVFWHLRYLYPLRITLSVLLYDS